MGREPRLGLWLACLAAAGALVVAGAGVEAALAPGSPPTAPVAGTSGPLPADLTAAAFLSPLEGFAVSADGGIFRLNDGGAYARRVAAFPGVTFRRLLFAGQRLGLALGRSGGRPVIVRTEDSGRTWRLLRPSPAPPFDRLVFAFPAARTVLAVAGPEVDVARRWRRFLYVSTDGGESWRARPLPRGLLASGGLAAPSPRRVFLTVAGGTTYALLETTDLGRRFRRLFGERIPLLAVAMAADGHGYLAGGLPPDAALPAEARLYITADDGRTWRLLFRRRGLPAFTGLYWDGASPDLYATTGPCPGRALPCSAPLLHSADGGRRWYAVSGGETVTWPSVEGDDAFYVTDPWPFGPDVGLLHDVWQGGLHRYLPPNPAALVVGSLSLVGRFGLLTANAGVFASQDGGASWRRVELPPPGGRESTVLVPRPGVLLDLSATHVLWEELGQSWQEALLPPAFSGRLLLVQAGAAAPDGPTYLVVARRSGGAALLVSEDGGRQFRQAAASVPAAAVTALAASGRRLLLVGPAPDQISESGDGGRTWHVVLTQPGAVFTAVALAGGRAFAAAVRPGPRPSSALDVESGGRWRRWPIGSVVVSELLFRDARHGFAVVRDTRRGNLLETTDGGASFAFVRPNLVRPPGSAIGPTFPPAKPPRATPSSPAPAGGVRQGRERRAEGESEARRAAPGAPRRSRGEAAARYGGGALPSGNGKGKPGSGGG